jgi:glycine oxidase
MESKKILIVGGGVAGCSLAVQLVEQGQNVTLIDRGKNESSVVAAGLINPLVFRRMTKSWRADELIPYAQAFYRSLENKTGKQFFHPIVIRRFFSSEQEKGFWIEKQEKDDFIAYMDPLSEEDLNYTEHDLKNDFGSARVKNASWVNTPVFMESTLHYLKTVASVRTEEFDHSALDPDNTIYKDEKFDLVIFAEGFQSYNNPWFSHFPVQHTKGEVLTARSADLPENESINRKCFVLPVGDQTYRIGATYAWDTKEATITEEGKKEILEKLSYMTSTRPEVVEHLAGIRPTSPDRRPIIGQHPEKKSLYLFNGLGTKGYMIAPLLAKEFIEYLLTGKAMHSETDLRRFIK